MRDRMAQIKQKGFNMARIATDDTNEHYVPRNFEKIKVGLKTLDDAVISYGDLKKTNSRLGDKTNVLKAINDNNVADMREISNFFYKTSGIYKRLCRYMAYLYKYDWFITPYIDGCQGLLDTDSGLMDTSQDDKQLKQRKKIFRDFFDVLKFFDQFEVKRFCGKVA